jgi:hypothetical protein
MTPEPDGPSCPACRAPVSEGQLRCPSCGEPLETSESATSTAPRPRQGDVSGSTHQETTRSGKGAPRFPLGTILAGRYRVLGLAGRGGMGEVYHAEDIKLDQQVALKFLPPGLDADRSRLERLFGEVRTARQVSHPAVCRVWDIGEADGHHFLSMEYIDGENLSSLLRRIGRLPEDKAIEIAEQVCAGLAAAHEKGVIHRDLKPANVMLDGQGKVRLTDFGLAGLVDSFHGADVRSGTPAFMAPEQIQGREVTVRSDIYSLGLVLYEIFTGRHAFEGRTRAELLRKQIDESPLEPSAIVHDLSPAVERTILACLQKSPRRRPASAMAVAAMLRGRDPLEAAIAAGDTPSPELVAAAGESEVASPRFAWSCAAIAVVGALLVAPLMAPIHIVNLVPPELPAAVLEHRAREVLEELGHTARDADSATGLFFHSEYFRSLVGSTSRPQQWTGLANGRPPIVHYWYRQSPLPLISTRSGRRVDWESPAIDVSGMAAISLDTEGRLLGFYSVPPQTEKPPETPSPDPDWSPLLAAAQLDPELLTPVPPEWTPPFFIDTRSAWKGTWPDCPDVPIRVEAGAYRGRVVWLQIIEPWTTPNRMAPGEATTGEKVGGYVGLGILIALMGVGGLLARHNLRQGRGDRRSASRLANVVLWLGLAVSILTMHHVASLGDEVGLLLSVAGPVLLLAMFLWVFYLALEPSVRRQRPRVLVSWTRLLAGGYRDAVVGRDVLIGVAWGSAAAVLNAIGLRSPEWLGMPTQVPVGSGLSTLLGTRMELASVVSDVVGGILIGLGTLLLYLIVRLALRRDWLAYGVVVVLLTLSWSWSLEPLGLWVILRLATTATFLWLLLRFGLVAAMTAQAVASTLLSIPLTMKLGAWYAQPTCVAVLVVIAVSVYAFRATLGGTAGRLRSLTSDTGSRL